MNKAVIFFCDITGTINGNIENSIEDYKHFVSLLTTIREENETENMIFSLVSTDNPEIIQKEISLLKNFFTESITIGKQFFENGYIEECQEIPFVKGKPFQILNYIKELQNKYEIIKVYFADDTQIYHEILFELAECFQFPTDQIISIIPKNNQGLSKLNELIELESIKHQNNCNTKKLIHY